MSYPSSSGSSATPIVDTFQVPGTEIQTATITETKTVKYFKVYVVSLDLFNSVTVSASLYDAAGATVGSRTFVISGAEYLAWNNNDQYLIDLVAQKMSFTLA